MDGVSKGEGGEMKAAELLTFELIQALGATPVGPPSWRKEPVIVCVQNQTYANIRDYARGIYMPTGAVAFSATSVTPIQATARGLAQGASFYRAVMRALPVDDEAEARLDKYLATKVPCG